MRIRTGISVLLAIVSFAAISCNRQSPSGVSGGNEMAVSVSLLKTSLAEDISGVALWVSIADELVFADTTTLHDGSFVFAPFSLPAGEAFFDVFAFDQTGRTIYSDSRTVTIQAGASNPVSLTLQPVVPMVRLAPYDLAAETGNQFSTTLELHNIRRFYSAQYTVMYDPSLLAYDFSVTEADPAWSLLISASSFNTGQLRVIVSREQGTGDAVPENATALVNIAFRALAPGETQLTLTVQSISDLNGTIQEFTDLFIDNQTIHLTGDPVILPGQLQGTVIDAQSGDPVEGALVELSGPSSQSTLTDALGEYNLEPLSLGSYLVSVSKQGYISNSRTVDVAGPATLADFALSRVLAATGYRIVLTWQEFPTDLDAHYFVGDYHVYYGDKGTLEEPPFAFLDLDDTDSFGPETVTIDSIIGPAFYVVHNFSGDVDIKLSGARVEVFNGTQRVASYNVPVTGTGFVWYVFDIDANGAIVPRNFLTDFASVNQSSPGKDSKPAPPR